MISKITAFVGLAATTAALVSSSEMDKSSKMFSLLLLCAVFNCFWAIMLWQCKRLHWPLLLGAVLGAFGGVLFPIKHPTEISAAALVLLLCVTLYNMDEILQQKEPQHCKAYQCFAAGRLPSTKCTAKHSDDKKYACMSCSYRTGNCTTCALSAKALGGCPYGK